MVLNMKKERDVTSMRFLTFGMAGLLIGLVFASTVHAATIGGTTYDGLTLEIAKNTVVSITTNPTQTKLSKDGTYSFEVGPGNYTIKATYSENGIVLLEASQPANVVADGNYTIDLILLPDVGDVPDEPLPDESPVTIWDQLIKIPLPWLGFLVIILGVIGYGIYAIHKHAQSKTGLTTSEIATQEPVGKTAKDEEIELDKYAVEILQLLKRGGNRTTQKDLRGMVSIGEAKVSLVVSELETYGFLKKIKRGRGNILILTEKGGQYLEKQTLKPSETISKSEENAPPSPEAPDA